MSNNIKVYNWGILAPGKIAHKFAEGLKLTNNGRLYAVASRNSDRASEFASKYNAEKAYGSYQELMLDKKVDIIYIASPHHLHFEHTRDCLMAEKAVLCEKPSSINSRQYKNLITLAGEKKVFMMDALWTRFHPHIIKVNELVQAGELGELKFLQADFGFKADYDPKGRLFNPELGGGTILDIGIYPIFLSLLLLGYPEDIQVKSVIGKTGVDESVGMIFKHSNGAISSLNCTFLANTETRANISGEKGQIIIPGFWFKPSSFQLITEHNDQQHFQFKENDNGYQYEANEVMKCLDEKKLESLIIPHKFTFDLLHLMDEVRGKAGIRYKEDSEKY
jgi:predicted dehydrogenase